MNRTFGITGLLAAGMAAFWVWFLCYLPWFPSFGPATPSPYNWLIWALWTVVIAIGLAGLIAFFRLSLTAHCRAICRNAPLPAAAWRGVCGIYLIVMIAFAIPVLAGNIPGSRLVELYLYGCLTAVAAVLGIISFICSFRRARPNEVNQAEQRTAVP